MGSPCFTTVVYGRTRHLPGVGRNIFRTIYRLKSPSPSVFLPLRRYKYQFLEIGVKKDLWTPGLRREEPGWGSVQEGKVRLVTYLFFFLKEETDRGNRTGFSTCILYLQQPVRIHGSFDRGKNLLSLIMYYLPNNKLVITQQKKNGTFIGIRGRNQFNSFSDFQCVWVRDYRFSTGSLGYRCQVFDTVFDTVSEVDTFG